MYIGSAYSTVQPPSQQPPTRTISRTPPFRSVVDLLYSRLKIGIFLVDEKPYDLLSCNMVNIAEDGNMQCVML